MFRVDDLALALAVVIILQLLGVNVIGAVADLAIQAVETLVGETYDAVVNDLLGPLKFW